MSNIYERLFQNGLIEGLAKHGFKLAPEGTRPPESIVPQNMSTWTWSSGMGSESKNTYNSDTRSNHLFVVTGIRIERIYYRFNTVVGRRYRFKGTVKTDPYSADSSGNGPLLYFSTSSNSDLNATDSTRITKISTTAITTTERPINFVWTANTTSLCVVFDACYLTDGNRINIYINDLTVTEEI